ncbi:hypothetical protein SAY86_020136 [Trapa natans]|uniref:PPM-type phosphatase domain-containing protein n=1 Tax=Trapa natans TaxID=22666 RepID=A0AAN7LM88_TRANT|nr:hypothetical protein SAY86_020136 [Trapa natans]
MSAASTTALDSSPATAFPSCSSPFTPFSWPGTATRFQLHSPDNGDERAEMGGATKRAKIEPTAGGLFHYRDTVLMDPPASRTRKPVSVLKPKKRPARLVLPEQRPSMADFSEMMSRRKVGGKEEESTTLQAHGRGYCLVSKKGRREIMEDGYGVTLDISGDPKQAFFTVVDGHGGRAAADYGSQNLGKNVLRAIESATSEANGTDPPDIEQAIRDGYAITDEEFLRKGVAGGACAASVLVKDGILHVSNVGDCRVVLSRNGIVDALTSDHRPSRADERLRIESSVRIYHLVCRSGSSYSKNIHCTHNALLQGGYVHFRNGVWRVQGSLAVSRAIGDIHLKQWIISEPETQKLPMTPDCRFLIIASDGLWDKVTGQEAVDVVSQEKSLQDSCRKLVEMSSSRGNLDDITVMAVDLRGFVLLKN